VVIFSSVESYLGPIAANLIEYPEGRANEYAYIRADKLAQLLELETAQEAN